MKLHRILYKQVDNSALIVFRIIFGSLLFLEAVGAIFTGWVKRAFITPEFTFTFIGFEWLQPLPGYGMYIYYLIMGICGLFVALGFKYRYSLSAFTLLWTITYLMQKSSYNNHYYLLIIICLIMLALPASNYFSLDSKKNPSIKKISMPQWAKYALVLQILIVYSYAAIAKLYPDWLDLTFIKILLAGKSNYPVIGSLMQQHWFHYFIAYGGLFFDLLIAIALLWKPSRKIAFAAAIFFHLFNSIVFQVGIFPYLGLALCLFFFDGKTIQRIFLKKKPLYNNTEVILPKNKNIALIFAGLFFTIQLLLPLRHWIIKDNILWTEEGHRMSWRMMLRSKRGNLHFIVKDKNSTSQKTVYPSKYLSSKQLRAISSKPDMIWQFAQFLKKEFKKDGVDAAVYAFCTISVNGKPYQKLIDSSVDLATEEWQHFKHHNWILPSKKEEISLQK